jgi:hypothetical protein
MGEKAVKREADEAQDLRQIPAWTRRYARNRTLPVLVFLAIIPLGFAAFAGFSWLTVWAYVTGRRVLAGASAVALSGFTVWWLWFSCVGAAKIILRATERLYRREGSVSVGPPEHAIGKPPHFVGFLFAFCVLASVALGLLGFLPIRYMQPISALYVVPFLIYLGIRLRGVGSPFMFVWPALYALHAILLVAGAPIYFAGHYTVLNVFVPMVGYGVVGALAGHLYSRLALRRLRTLAKSPEAESPAVSMPRDPGV